MISPFSFRTLPLLTCSLGIAACTSNGPLVFDLMPAPAAYTDTGIKLYQVAKEPEPFDIFFATDREPAGPNSPKTSYYTSNRGAAVRIGSAMIGPAADRVTWDDFRDNLMRKERGGGFPIKVNDVREYGILNDSIHDFSRLSPAERSHASAAERRYVGEINAKLAKSGSKTINIYIHGYKVTFENPVLTSSELWSYLGNEGAFIAYSWPATPRALAYFSDSETALYSARNLRNFLRFLAENTRVETINVVAYSAGTRVLSRALADLALQEGKRPSAEIRRRLKLGTAVLLAGDVDLGIIGGYLNDGVDRVVDQLILYQSDSDKALSVSRFLTNANRIGQSFDVDTLDPEVKDYLGKHPRVSVVDVSDADSARKGNGHGYLRGSPWVSSDLLMSLAYGLPPAERGLVRKAPGVALWTFPPDYIPRLRLALLKQQ